MRKNNLLSTYEACVLIESKLRAAKLTMRCSPHSLLTESRLNVPRGLGKTLSSLPPVMQAARRKTAFYDKALLTTWIDKVLIPALSPKGNTLENQDVAAIPSILQPTLAKSESVKETEQPTETEKEAFLGNLISLSFKFADTVIFNESYSKARYGATPQRSLRSQIALDVIRSATNVDILQEFNLTHAPR